MSERIKSFLLAAEFAVLFFGIPLVIFLVKRFPLPSMFLVPVLIFIFLILRYRTDFRWKELVYLSITRKQLARDGIILSCSAVCLIIMVLTLMPGKFLNLPRANPWIWLALGTFYPVFSAFPQEILYRTFIFRRYTRIFPGKWPMIAASGVSFGFVHILYYHPISMLLTLIGGIYLASTYNRTRSVLYTAILHGVLGMFVFTVGLGEYFWLEMYDYL
jgi:membrane protease YdiL (CAAX protease family)